MPSVMESGLKPLNFSMNDGPSALVIEQRIDGREAGKGKEVAKICLLYMCIAYITLSTPCHGRVARG